jgi:hypothetical protein
MKNSIGALSVKIAARETTNIKIGRLLSHVRKQNAPLPGWKRNMGEKKE